MADIPLESIPKLEGWAPAEEERIGAAYGATCSPEYRYVALAYMAQVGMSKERRRRA